MSLEDLPLARTSPYGGGGMDLGGTGWGEYIARSKIKCSICGNKVENLGQFRMVGGKNLDQKYLGIIANFCGHQAEMIISQRDLHRTIYVFGDPPQEIETEEVQMFSLNPEKQGKKIRMLKE